jgi:hypothetical protein
MADLPGQIIIDGVVYAPKWSVEPAVDFYNSWFPISLTRYIILFTIDSQSF